MKIINIKGSYNISIEMSEAVDEKPKVQVRGLLPGISSKVTHNGVLITGTPTELPNAENAKC